MQLQELFGTDPDVIKPGLSRIRTLCSHLGLHLTTPAVLIAGTNGKGSVATYIHKCLVAHGIHGGLYTSPHLKEVNERCMIGDEFIPHSELLKRATEIKGLNEEHQIGATTFEMITALSLWYFEDQRVDIMIVEVGLGGRFDATNILSPLCSVITSIGLDHEEYLGSSLTQIAFEKAGIVKRNTPVFLGKMDEESFLTIREIAISRNSPCVAFLQDYDLELEHKSWRYKYQDFSFLLPSNRSYPQHQLNNLALALRVLFFLHQNGLFEPTINLLRSTGLINIPGRLTEQEWNGFPVVLDVAHNPDAIQSLCQSLKKKGIEPIFALSILRDKNFKQMVNVLSEFANPIVAFSNSSPRSWQEGDLKSHYPSIPFFDSFHEAIQELSAKIKKGQIIVVTGSFYALEVPLGEMR